MVYHLTVLPHVLHQDLQGLIYLTRIQEGSDLGLERDLVQVCCLLPTISEYSTIGHPLAGIYLDGLDWDKLLTVKGVEYLD